MQTGWNFGEPCIILKLHQAISSFGGPVGQLKPTVIRHKRLFSPLHFFPPHTPCCIQEVACALITKLLRISMISPNSGRDVKAWGSHEGIIIALTATLQHQLWVPMLPQPPENPGLRLLSLNHPPSRSQPTAASSSNSNSSSPPAPSNPAALVTSSSNTSDMPPHLPTRRRAHRPLTKPSISTPLLAATQVSRASPPHDLSVTKPPSWSPTPPNPP